MSDQLCGYVRQRLNPGDGRMTLRHDLDRLFRDFTCKAVHCTLPLYAVFAGSRGIGKSLVIDKILKVVQAHYRLRSVHMIRLRLSGMHSDLKIAKRHIWQQLSRACARDITGKELPSEHDAFIRSSLCYIGLLVEIDDLEIYLAKPVKTDQSVLAYLVQLASLQGNKGVMIVGVTSKQLQSSDLRDRFPGCVTNVPVVPQHDWQQAVEQYGCMLSSMLHVTDEEVDTLKCTGLQDWNSSVRAALGSPSVTEKMTLLARQGVLWPSKLATACRWMLKSQDCLLTAAMVLDGLAQAFTNPTVGYINKRSTLELLVLIAMFRAGQGGQKATHFDAMMHEYSKVMGMIMSSELEQLGALDQAVVWGVFSSLKAMGLLQPACSSTKEELHIPPQYQKAVLTVKKADLRQGMQLSEGILAHANLDKMLVVS